ncbi:MAG: hypothetical protein FWC61_01655 [Proteobacteria bacterium]|nr:hypothetical protein [Pseudomonadota bacterium]
MNNLDAAQQILKNDFSDINYPTNVVEDYSKAIVQSPEQLIKSRTGHCWEQTELARYLFNKNNIPCRAYNINFVYNDAGNTHTHTFLVFQSEDAFYWFEHSWAPMRGIHRYDSLKELLLDVVNKLSMAEKQEGYEGKIFRLCEYGIPKLPMGHMECFEHFLNSKEIKIEDL